MNSFYKSFFPLLSILLFNACQKEEHTENTTQEISLSLDIKKFEGAQASTDIPDKTPGETGSFTHGNEIGLSVSGSGITPELYKYVVGETTLTWDALQIPQNVTEVKFAGCYPYPATQKDHKFLFNISTATDKDLLLAPAITAQANTSAPIMLNFKHAMHRLEVNYTAENTEDQESMNQIKTTLTGATTCEVDLAAGSISTTLPESGTFTATGSNVTTLMIPQPTTQVKIKITIHDSEIEYLLSDLIEQSGSHFPTLESGKSLRLNLKVKKDQTIHIIGSDIEGWENQGEIDGEIDFT